MFRQICRENQDALFSPKVFVWKSCSLWDEGGKYGRAGQATVGNITRHPHFACCTNNAISSHSVWNTISHKNSDFAKRPQK